MTFPAQLLLGAPVGTTAGWALGQLAVVYPTDADFTLTSGHRVVAREHEQRASGHVDPLAYKRGGGASGESGDINIVTGT